MRTSIPLPAGVNLGPYRVERVLGQGGFGITYLCFDYEAKRQVAIKELYPVEFASRSSRGSHMIHPKDENSRKLFEWARKSFIQEIKIIQEFDHDAIVRVIRSFSANGTHYMVMEFIPGYDLKGWSAVRSYRPSQSELVDLMVSILSGIQKIHRKDYLHRDLKPGNIIVRNDGRPVIVDFGASRIDVSKKITDPRVGKRLTVVLDESFAPYEQFDEHNRKPWVQGPWTDLYALCATFRFLLFGSFPDGDLTAKDRFAEYRASNGRDPHKRLTQFPRLLETYSAGFLEALDWGMELYPEHRPQSASVLAQRLQNVRNDRPGRKPTIAGEDFATPTSTLVSSPIREEVEKIPRRPPPLPLPPRSQVDPPPVHPPISHRRIEPEVGPQTPQSPRAVHIPALNTSVYFGLFGFFLLKAVIAIIAVGMFRTLPMILSGSLIVLIGGGIWAGLVPRFESELAHLHKPVSRVQSIFFSLTPGLSIYGRIHLAKRMGESYGISGLLPIAVITEVFRFVAWVLLATSIGFSATEGAAALNLSLAIILAMVGVLHGLGYALIGAKCGSRPGRAGRGAFSGIFAIIGVAVGILVLLAGTTLERFLVDPASRSTQLGLLVGIIEGFKLMLAVFACVAIAFPQHVLRAFGCSFVIAAGITGSTIVLNRLEAAGTDTDPTSILLFPGFGVLAAALFAAAFRLRFRPLLLTGLIVGLLYFDVYPIEKSFQRTGAGTVSDNPLIYHPLCFLLVAISAWFPTLFCSPHISNNLVHKPV